MFLQSVDWVWVRVNPLLILVSTGVCVFWVPSQSNGQTERKNQEMETALCCLVSSNPCSWAQHLVWVEYTHTLTSSASDLSPFQCPFGFQLPLFPALEKEASSPSVQIFIQRCHHTWTQACNSLICAANHYTASANCHHSQVPEYQVEQKVWLSTKNHPLRFE